MLNEKQIHGALFGYSGSFDPEAVMASFQVHGQTPEDGVIRNFLGTRIPPSVFPSILTDMAGHVEPLPVPGNWHADIAEWGAALFSVQQAKDLYRIVELGCGWGCWITNMGNAARARGLKVDLIGIEGDSYHLASARQVLEMNGFSDTQARVFHGVAGPRPGKAIFPVHATEGENWGAEPVFDPSPEALAKAENDPGAQVLECMPLGQLSQGQRIDLLHIDIQGAETDFVRGNQDQMNAHVARVLIGTHSRAIEGDLCRHFLDLGWQMEIERPALNEIVDGRPDIRIDGVQLWANPALV